MSHPMACERWKRWRADRRQSRAGIAIRGKISVQKRRSQMKKQTLVSGVILSVLAGLVLASQDKYTLKVPGGLSFSEFRGYEGWQAISISRNEKVMAMTLANPVMI